MSDDTTTTTHDSAQDFGPALAELVRKRGISLAELATRAGLEPSLLSRLTSENPASRRAPRPEHILRIARVLEVHPFELGRQAQSILLVEWVARAELEREITARQQAQTEAAQVRLELETLRAGELAALREQNAQLERTTARTAEQLARAQGAHRRAEVQLADARVRAAHLEHSRRELTERVHQLELELADAHQRGRALWEQLQQANSHALTATLLGTLGTIGGAASGYLVGQQAAKPKPPKRRKR